VDQREENHGQRQQAAAQTQPRKARGLSACEPVDRIDERERNKGFKRKGLQDDETKNEDGKEPQQHRGAEESGVGDDHQDEERRFVHDREEQHEERGVARDEQQHRARRTLT